MGKKSGETRRRLGICQGEKHPLAKVTEDIVRDLRSRFADREPTRAETEAIAAPLGICPLHVRAILNRKCWKHIE